MKAQTQGKTHDIDTPFGRPSDHIIEADWGGVPVFFLSRHGPGHLINPSQINFRANLFALKKLGVTHIIASGAVGSLRDHLRPRDLCIPDQIIDKTCKRPNTFFDKAAVHVEFAEPFCPVMRRILLEAGKLVEETQDISQQPEDPAGHALHPFKVHDGGCYVCMEGPAFSTKAESLMHRLWGGDLIGMTAMPEAKLAKEAEMSYALVALVTDYECWRPHGGPAGPGLAKQEAPPPPDPAVLLKEIIANLQAATDNGIRLIQKAVSLIAGRSDDLLTAPALQALKMAIWSDKSKIDREAVELLGPIWMKYM
jgi:5'-methylthioadenosine phosphorylase